MAATSAVEASAYTLKRMVGAVAADWADGLPVADAAYGLAFQASMLRVDLTKRVGDPFNRKPALTLKLADARNRLKAP